VISCKLGLPLRHHGLLILDIYKTHGGEPFLNALKANSSQVVFISASCTGEMQPLDVAGNKPFEDALRNKFNEWYSVKISEALASGNNIAETQIDLKISTLKPLHSAWMLRAFVNTAQHYDILLTGWVDSGLS